MLEYTSLFSDLEELFRTTDRHPASFRRLAKEVQRAGDDLREYYREVANDYVARLEQRLAQPGATLSEEEIKLVRGYLGLPPQDAERERLLIETLGRLDAAFQELGELKGRPLSLRNLDALLAQLHRMQAELPLIVDALEERDQVRRFEEALGADEGRELDREALRHALRQALGVEPEVGSDESRVGFVGGT